MKKEKWIQIRVSEAQLQRVKEAAARHGVKVSQYVLMVIDGEVKAVTSLCLAKEEKGVVFDEYEPLPDQVSERPKEEKEVEKRFKPSLCKRCRPYGVHDKKCTIPGCGGS